MDRKLSENPEIQRLIQLSALSRSLLDSQATHLRHRVDVPARIRSSLQHNPGTWIISSLALGLAASLIFSKKPAATKKRRGITGILLGLTLTAARPLAKVWLGNQLRQWASGTSAGSPMRFLSSLSAPTSNSP